MAGWWNPIKQRLSIQRICVSSSVYMVHRSLLPGGGGGGFHYYELLLGMLLAGAIAYLAYWRYNSSLERALTRKQKGEAIQVRLLHCSYNCCRAVVHAAQLQCN